VPIKKQRFTVILRAFTFVIVRRQPSKKWGTNWGAIPLRGGVRLKFVLLEQKKLALTDAAIRATKPSKKPFKMYDREDLFILINPGGSKLWRWRYWAAGKES
jgi:hypothetical protein